VKRNTLEPDAKLLELKDEAIKAKQRLQERLKAPNTAWDNLEGYYRESILSSPLVLVKLAGATIWGIPTEEIANFFGNIAGEIPVGGGKKLKDQQMK
jgi:hypothetical protein